MRLRFRKFAVLCATALLTQFAIMSCGSRGVEVSVTNKTGSDLHQVALEFTGGVATVPLLHAGETYRTRVRPTGDTHLQLKYIDAGGKEYSDQIGVYFGQGSGGQITLNVLPGGTNTWTDKVKM
jgi:hypothetical protein